MRLLRSHFLLSTKRPGRCGWRRAGCRVRGTIRAGFGKPHRRSHPQLLRWAGGGIGEGEGEGKGRGGEGRRRLQDRYIANHAAHVLSTTYVRNCKPRLLLFSSPPSPSPAPKCRSNDEAFVGYSARLHTRAWSWLSRLRSSTHTYYTCRARLLPHLGPTRLSLRTVLVPPLASSNAVCHAGGDCPFGRGAEGSERH